MFFPTKENHRDAFNPIDLFELFVGLEIYGLEVDQKWWQSPYAIAPFISTIRYLEQTQWNDLSDDGRRRFLQECCSCERDQNDWNFVLMFCYFNDFKAFLQYLCLYQGVWLLIIGPATTDSSSLIFTEPLPLQANFNRLTVEAGAGNWVLYKKISIGFQGRGDAGPLNTLALYKRTNLK